MTRSRAAGGSLAGRRVRLDCGPVGHGGFVVARVPADVPEIGGVVVFVRHALPGETVVAAVTEGLPGDRFLRADAVEVVSASEHRVTPPCPLAGPGGCGGCDLQHVSPEHQRVWKAQVVSEQLRRLAGIEREVEVATLRSPEYGTRWRRRMRYHRLPDGGLGLRRHRSHELVAVEDCLVQAPDAVVVVADEQTGHGRSTVTERVGEHDFEVMADGFWQPHRDAPRVYTETVLDLARPRAGGRVLDLYAGVGLFSVPLARAVGPHGEVLAVEGDRDAAALAVDNLTGFPWASVRRGSVVQELRALAARDAAWDVVVLDPPRAGARRPVVEAIAALRPRRVVHVACDPASFARDVALLAEAGYDLEELRAFDAFPMTHHVEVVAGFSRARRTGEREDLDQVPRRQVS